MVSRVLAPMAIEVIVATPSMGVTRVGVLAKTKAPEPVSSEIAVDKAKEVEGEHPVQLVTVRTLKVGEEVVARAWLIPSRLAHSEVVKVLFPIAIEVAFKVPVRVEVPSTFKVVTLAVSVINLLADKSVTEKMEAPPKLVE